MKKFNVSLIPFVVALTLLIACGFDALVAKDITSCLVAMPALAIIAFQIGNMIPLKTIAADFDANLSFSIKTAGNILLAAILWGCVMGLERITLDAIYPNLDLGPQKQFIVTALMAVTNVLVPFMLGSIICTKLPSFANVVAPCKLTPTI